MLKKLWERLSRKLLYVLIAILLESARAQWPELPLPPTDLVVDLTLALLATHTLTDSVALMRAAIGEWAEAFVAAKQSE